MQGYVLDRDSEITCLHRPPIMSYLHTKQKYLTG